jgi:hypothetical protein
MIRNLSLKIPMPFYRIGYTPVPLTLILQNVLRKQLFQDWPLQVLLTPGDLGHLFVFSEMIYKAVCKIFFDEEVIMVGHEALGVSDPVIAFIGVLEGIEEVQAVLVVPEDGLLLVPARYDVVDSTWIFYAEGTGHKGATVSRNKAIVKLQDVTL